MALAKTEFAYRRNQARPNPQPPFPKVSLDDVVSARDFVAKVGNIDRAKNALDALERFRPNPAEATQPPENHEEQENHKRDIRDHGTFKEMSRAASY